MLMDRGVFVAKCFKALNIVRESDYILLAGHQNPDGDSIGSVLGFSNALYENEGKIAQAYSVDEVSSAFDFLNGYENISQEIKGYPDCFVGFDYGDFSRLCVDRDTIQGARIITFDHHPEGGQQGDVCVIETSVASTTEILYKFMRTVNWDISVKTASCLLTGIITDTGAFSHNTFYSTFLACGDLVRRGANIPQVYQRTMGGKSQKVLNVWGRAIEKTKKDEEYNFHKLFLSFEEFSSYGVVLDDLAGVVSVINKIDDSDFALFVVEYEPRVIKGSLRGEEFKGVAVSPIAAKLGGGGHAYAAGFTLNMSFDKAVDKIISAAREYATSL